MAKCSRKACQAEDAKCEHMNTGEMYCERCAHKINSVHPQFGGCLVMYRYDRRVAVFNHTMKPFGVFRDLHVLLLALAVKHMHQEIEHMDGKIFVNGELRYHFYETPTYYNN